MKTSTKVALGVAALIVGWHVIVALSAKLKVSSLFMAKPAQPGYVWTDAENADSRFFWQTTGVKWVAGVAHPDFGAETTEVEGTWQPMPGYAFVDKTKGLETVWQSRLLHPDFQAWSDDVEGQWIPVTGYRFVYEGDTFVETVWDPNKRYDDLKVISMAEQDGYKPFPGYTFTEPGQSLKVVWTPGTVNYENTKLVAGSQEGAWVINSNPSGVRTQYAARRRRGITDREVGAFAIGVGTGVILDRALIRRW